MATYSEVCEFLEEISEVPETVEDDLSFFKHANNSSESCQLICTEPFDRMPQDIVETFIIKANPFEVSFE